MPNLRQLLLGFACMSLVACAAGVPGDELDFSPEETPQLDAGLPPLATALPPQLSGPILQPAAPQPAPSNPSVSQSSSAATVPSTSTGTSASASTPTTSTPTQSTPTTSTPTQSTPTTSTPASTQDAGSSSSSTRDAGVSTPATPAPAPAPMCVASKCNINCALLLPCCDQKGQCMCLSPIRGCVLPPL